MRSRTTRIWRLHLGVAALLATTSAPAEALTIADVDLLSFPLGGANTGFVNAGPGFDHQIGPSSSFLCVGAAPFEATGACASSSQYDVTVSQSLQTVHQFPQDRGAQNTPGDPFIADSLWTFTNTSGEALDANVLILFTNVVLGPFPGSLVPTYPDLQVGLDGNLLEITRFSNQGDFFYGTLGLGGLGVGESVQRTVRYVVSSGELPIVDDEAVMPPLAVLGVAVVPEPGATRLFVCALIGFAAARRAR